MEPSAKDHLPTLGVGLSFRPEIAGPLCEHVAEFDFVEVIIDNALGGALDARFWNTIVPNMPLVAHGVNTSMGSLQPLDLEYLGSVAQAAQAMHCCWFSEHLAFTQSDDVEIGQLIPVQFSEQNVVFIVDKVRAASRALRLPLLLENISYYFQIPGSTMTEVDFLLKVLEGARCGLLLDVHNLYANSINHDFDPYEFMDRLPAAAVVEIHVAGGAWHDELYVDTHGHAVSSEVLALVDYALATKQPKAIVLEREKNFPPMAELLDELRELKRLWSKHLRE
jgi:hypothetical protein